MSGFLTILTSVLAPIAKQAVVSAGHELVDYLNMILS
ncbi:hypothetical protein C7374_10454 [Falsochrobactrum ovis]|uniref:Uncharacterized protein n=1 Tax=Falsochrobactrum ovis TaxID=1293442 RepID=A0A364JVS0_9HYPH|nr:hypothetical protein C7374_10454 [Falsochrobactrum ovis]